MELSAPHNWCDRRCERCPLATVCPIGVAPPEDLETSSRKALAMVEEIAVEEGLDLDAPVEIARSLDEQLLTRASMDWAVAVKAVWDAAGIVAWDGRTMLLHGKVVRVATSSNDDDELFALDVAPNLLVIEHTLGGVRAEIDALRTRVAADAIDRYDAVDRMLSGLLAPMMGRITAGDRAVIAALTAARQAPSPFVVV